MKILVNLLSEQRVPNLIAVRYFSPDIVFALSTESFKNQIKDFEYVTGIKHIEIPVEAYNVAENLMALSNALEQKSDNELIVNYTGGTKIMAVSAILHILINIRRKVQLVYINSKDSEAELIHVSEDNTLAAEKKRIDMTIPVEDLFNLNGEEIASYDSGLSEQEWERKPLSELLMKNNDLSVIFSKQKHFFDDRHFPLKANRLTLHKKNTLIDLYWNANEIIFHYGLQHFHYQHNDGGTYFTGSWLEELIFSKLFFSKRFDTVIKNLKIKFEDDVTYKIKNEIDIMVTKGLKTAFIECKAGNIKQDHIYKLRAITNYFLGSFGVPILLARFKPNANVMEKCKNLGVVVFTSRQYDYLDIEIEKLLS